MMIDLRTKLPWLLALILLAAQAGVLGLSAQPAAAQQQQDENDDESQMPSWLRRMARIREPGRHERNHDSVKTAFIEVVGKSAAATVLVYGDGVAVALGAIVDENGYVLTKYSELQDDLLCQLNDGRRFAAQIVGASHEHDLAMLKIDATGLTPIEWADSPPGVGGWVVTVGFDRLPAAIGVVSVAPRQVEAPSGMLGVQVNRDQEAAKIERIIEGSGAEEAGLQVGDEVLHINGKRIASGRELIDTLGTYHVGDRVRLSIKRGAELLTIHATLRSRRDLLGQNQFDSQEDLAGPLSNRRNGFPLVLQHDTVLRPRDCGGPLVDLDGKAVGLNIARAGRVSSFATPAATIRPLLADLMSGKLAPGLSDEEEQLQLAETIRSLQSSVADWTAKLKTLQTTLESAQQEYDAAKLASAGDQSAQAIIALKKAEQHKSDIEKDARRAQRELDKAVAELKKYDTQKVSVGS